MSLDESDLQLIAEMTQTIVHKALSQHLHKLLGRVGIAGDAAGYDPTDGTAGHGFGHTYGFFDDDDGQTIVHPRIVLGTTQIGDLYGPTGNERVVLLRTQAGFVALYHHGPDDSPQVPAGERHILHKTKATQGQVDAGGQPVAAQYDGGVKFTNDGPNEGDGLGGTELGNKGAQTSTVTNRQIGVHTRDDLMQTGVGDNPGNLVIAENAAARLNDMKAALTQYVRTHVGNVFLQYTQAIKTLGGLPTATEANDLYVLLASGAGFPSITELTGLIPGIADISVPDCSEVVLIK